MNKIEEAVVTYDHDAKGTLEGILINGVPLYTTLTNMNEEKGDKILANAQAFIKEGVGKVTIHDLLLSYVEDRKNNPLIVRHLDEEIIFLYAVGKLFLSITKDLTLIKNLGKRIMAGPSNGEDCVTKTIEDFIEHYSKSSMEAPLPKVVLAIVFTALIGETMKLMKNPMFGILIMMDL